MKTIAIVTLTRNPNYGNVLQNIALQKVLTRMGYTVETIINQDHSTLFREKKSLKYIVKCIINKDGCGREEKRRLRFLSCCKSNISYSKYIYSGSDSMEAIPEYNYYVVGSDQVWNPFFGVATDFEMLRFAPQSKRISYAASFGVSSLAELPDQRKEQMIQGLKGFDVISVREDAGKRIVEELTGIPCYVHLDPTMLVDSSQWHSMARKPKRKLPEKYILVYMLGEISEAYKKIIRNMCAEDTKVINMLDETYKVLDPTEFIWMIEHSECVCTDSFHATVFSILFHKEFFVFDKVDDHKKQNSRFDTLFNKMGICDRVVSSVDEKCAFAQIDWNTIDEHLKTERKISQEYLAVHLR